MSLLQYDLTPEKIKDIQRMQDYAHERIRKGQKICGKVCSLDNGHISRIYKQTYSFCEQVADVGFVYDTEIPFG